MKKVLFGLSAVTVTAGIGFYLLRTHLGRLDITAITGYGLLIFSALLFLSFTVTYAVMKTEGKKNADKM